MLAVAHVLGLMMAFFAVTFLMPLICAVIYQDGMFIDFAAAAAINVALGLAIAAATRRYKRELKPRDGFLLVNTASNGSNRATLQSNSRWAGDFVALAQVTYNNTRVEAFRVDPDELPVIDSRTRIDGLKIDIEGHEDKALAPFLDGGERSMLPRRIVIEHPEPDADYPGCAAAFARHGYELVGRTRNNSLYRLAHG